MSVPKDHRIEFQDRGLGVPVLFVPGSFSRLAAWKPIYADLKQSYRVIETSLCGYGQTFQTRSHGDLAMSHQLHVLANVTARAATPLHILGHSFARQLRRSSQ